MARCPECNTRLTLSADLERRDHIFCIGCGAELEILNKSPLELEAVYDFEEDDLLEELEDDEDDMDWEVEEDDLEDNEEDW